MTKWMRGPELDRKRDHEPFDPVVEGARYQLSRELSLAIWERVCADATDGDGRHDVEQARRRFHKLAARIAARGGRLRPDVGRVTRVGIEQGDEVPGFMEADELAIRTPGRETLVAVEARRWAQRSGEPAVARVVAEAAEGSEIAGPAAAREVAEAAEGSEIAGPTTARRELPDADEVMRAMAALQRPAHLDQVEPVAAPVRAPRSRLLDIGLMSARRPAAAKPDTLPGFAGAAALREQLLAAATSGRGAGAALAAAEPATAAAVLHELRSVRVPGQAAPVLQLVARADGGEATRMLGRGSVGTPLPDEAAARLGPHVGDAVAGAARLHTDDAADLVAAAHHAHAVTLGDDIYFARGEYSPGTARGDELLVHELTHVAQAQRGELTRAAAKGLDSGETLDPAEAEADLRARLAVLQLHAPELAAPELAAPSGQPASDGDRAAKLAAQQQRLDLASQDTPADDAVPAPPPWAAQAPAAHPPPELAAAPAASATRNAYVETFEAAPSRQATELWDQAGTQATTQAAADQAAFDSALPPLPVVLDGSEAPGAEGGAAAPAPAEPLAADTTPPATGTTPPAAEPTPTPTLPPATDAPAVPPSTDTAQQQADARQAIDALPTTLPDGLTNPGTALVTDLAGQADPMRAIGDRQNAATAGAQAFEAEKQRLVAQPGAARVQPVKIDEQLAVPAAQAAGPMPALVPVDGMAKFKAWNLPANAQAPFDDVAKPRMDASLAEAKAKMAEAEVKRDADRALAVDDAHAKVTQAHADADQQQQARVAQTRTQIANHQADTLQSQQTQVKQLDQLAGDRKKTTIGTINDRLKADQAQVDADYRTAQTRAEEQRQQGEADVARRKQEAQDQAGNQSWWDQIASAIGDAIQAIADEINQALDAIGQAIGAILDEVKNAACELIDAACDFVCQALTEFGDWLQAAVTALIGSVFPELAAALNQLIDAAVAAATEAMTAIADDLKQAVTALCDGLKAAIDAAIAVFQAAVQAAATFAQAVMTGDWSLVARMVLDGILSALGIDPAAFYVLIGQAEDSIEQIIDDPGAFVGHLVDAVKLGFQQFGTNFWTHLQSGMVQWLFGTFSEAGIQMPASFDLAGIFDLVAQILGLTWDRLRGKVVDLIGEENTERLEFVAQYVEALITGGFAGLWEKIQQDLSNLWEMVIGGARDWLIQNVVQQAILKIATMWNPAGAIFELIQTAWNAYQWLRDNAQRIFGLVQAVVDSVSNIVAGDISGAANWIEQSLAQLVPIAISLFADLIGLGGIAGEMRRIIEDVQQAVDEAIDALIARVMAMFTGSGEADGEEDQESEDIETPKSLAEPTTPAMEQIAPGLATEITAEPIDRAIFSNGGDPKEVTKQILSEHEDAHYDDSSGVLTLPPLDKAPLAQAASLGELGQLIAQQLGVSKVMIKTTNEPIENTEPYHLERGQPGPADPRTPSSETAFDITVSINPILKILSGALTSTGDLTTPQYLNTTGSFGRLGGPRPRGNVLMISPSDWDHILKGHVKSTFDPSTRSGKVKSTVFNGTPEEYANLMEEACGNAAVLRDLNAAIRNGSKGAQIQMTLRGQSMMMMVDWATSAACIKTFHANGRITNPHLYEVI